MPTAAERQALAFLTGVALLGGGVRAYQGRHGSAGVPPPRAASESASVARGEGAGDQLRAIDSARRGRTRSRAPGEARDGAGAPPHVVDVDVAGAAELEGLPYIGEALAARIVADRESLGAFGSLEALGRVRGIGPALEKRLAGMVTFSGTAREPPAETTAASRSRTIRRAGGSRERPP